MAASESWRIVARHPAGDLRQFLADREPRSTVMSERLRNGPLDRQVRSGGRFFFNDEHGAAVYQGPGGFFYPEGLAETPAPVRYALAERLGAHRRLHSIMGTTVEVDSLEELIRGRATSRVDYELRALAASAFPPSAAPPVSGLAVARPRPGAWRRLLPLQMAYEIEEVLLPGHQPNVAVSRATLIDSLENQIVLVAVVDEAIVARVATNARGYRCAQVGGVYTDPAWRGRGIARWLMVELFRQLAKDGVCASLFVKVDNAAARRLYDSLGFLFESAFRISYYG